MNSNRNTLSLLPLSILIFYNVCGGPFGIEASIRAGGAFASILGFLLFPFIWSIPEALVTAELGSALPHASGGVAWVEEAFGRRIGALSGYLNWTSGATDNAIYPTLCLQYIYQGFVDDQETISMAENFWFVVIISLALSLFNYMGLKLVGQANIIICILSMSPFIVMSVMGAPRVNVTKWFKLPDPSLIDDTALDMDMGPGFLPRISWGGILWRPFLNNLFWNLNSFDSAASFVTEVSDYKTTFPKACFLSVGMCFFSYLIPLLVAVGVSESEQIDWVDGHLAVVAKEIGGSWLTTWTVFAAGISNFALFEAEMSADAYQLMGMAELGYLPPVFKMKSSHFGTPTMGILTGTIVVVCMGALANLEQIVEMLNFNYSIGLLLEFAAFVKLRHSQKDMQRPYRVPIPDWAAAFFVFLPCTAIVFLCSISSFATYAFSFLTIAITMAFHVTYELIRNNEDFTVRATHQLSGLGEDTPIIRQDAGITMT